MGQAVWQAAPDGRYWIDVMVGNRPMRVLVDQGLIDPLHRVGLEIDPAVYDQLKNSGQLSSLQLRSWRGASGTTAYSESGSTTAQLADPVSRQPIGPPVPLFVNRGVAGLPNRAGVVFFHGLTGCRVLWNLDKKTWTVEYP